MTEKMFYRHFCFILDCWLDLTLTALGILENVCFFLVLLNMYMHRNIQNSLLSLFSVVCMFMIFKLTTWY